MTSVVIFEKSGLKRNSTPAIAPGSMHDAMTRMMSRTKSVGMSNFEMRSIPFFTPRIITKCVSNTNPTAHNIGRIGLDENSTKYLLT